MELEEAGAEVRFAMLRLSTLTRQVLLFESELELPGRRAGGLRGAKAFAVVDLSGDMDAVRAAELDSEERSVTDGFHGLFGWLFGALGDGVSWIWTCTSSHGSWPGD